MTEQLEEVPRMVDRGHANLQSFLSRQARQRSMEQNIENPVEVKVPKISSQESVEAVKNCTSGACFCEDL